MIGRPRLPACTIEIGDRVVELTADECRQLAEQLLRIVNEKEGAGLIPGTIVRWEPHRGYGFVRRNAGGPGIFCHWSMIEGCNAAAELTPGRWCFFSWIRTPGARTGGSECRDSC